jgi:D-alanyl-D-alanine dipeptidase
VPPPGDVDADGIPDPLDVLVGARKAALNADHYDGRYERISYPLGDVPRGMGVCTDVVIRALRNAGIDLQQDVHEDILRAPRAYPSVSRPNTNIDHRRVKSLLPYFQRHFEAHSVVPTASDPYRPGDVVFMDTFSNRSGAEHVGIVSDVRNPAGVPLIINNWTDGTVTTDMDLIAWGVPVTHRFRALPRNGETSASGANNGEAGLPPAGDAGPIPPHVTQLVVVLSVDFDDWHARVQRYQRKPGGSFRRVGSPVSAVLGAAGFGWGDGLHGHGPPAGRQGPLKREGDLRSPAGVFSLGTVHGYAASAGKLRLPYQQATADQRCVDDVSSPYYNQIVNVTARGEPWRSAEHMLRDDGLYELALDIQHNRSPISPGKGSCIFAHVWSDPEKPVTGCTAFAKNDLRRLLEWLKPNSAAWVALPKAEYLALRFQWGLP